MDTEIEERAPEPGRPPEYPDIAVAAQGLSLGTLAGAAPLAFAATARSWWIWSRISQVTCWRTAPPRTSPSGRRHHLGSGSSSAISLALTVRAAVRGAAGAIQVANRFHLWACLRDSWMRRSQPSSSARVRGVAPEPEPEPTVRLALPPPPDLGRPLLATGHASGALALDSQHHPELAIWMSTWGIRPAVRADGAAPYGRDPAVGVVLCGRLRQCPRARGGRLHHQTLQRRRAYRAHPGRICGVLAAPSCEHARCQVSHRLAGQRLAPAVVPAERAWLVYAGPLRPPPTCERSHCGRQPGCRQSGCRQWSVSSGHAMRFQPGRRPSA
jgi:hypothetical protein